MRGQYCCNNQLIVDRKSIEETGKQNLSENKALFKKLKKRKPGDVDRLINDAHEEAFDCIDCLQCANCCKTTGPLFTQKDIERISKHLRMKPGQFIEQYLKIDEDDDYVLQNTPCAFLGSDNYCSIYEVRPKACAEYPHTDARGQMKLSKLTLKNSLMCPAVQDVLDRVKEASSL